MTDKLSVAVGAGIAVAGVFVLGSWQASATPASGVALIHAIQKAEPDARYHIPRYRRCRIAGYRMDRYGYCASRTLTLSDRPELRIDPTTILSTGSIANVSHAQVYSAEAAAGLGPLFFQGEYFWFKVEREFGLVQHKPNVAIDVPVQPHRVDGLLATGDPGDGADLVVEGS